jgi:hypothetical protein
MAQIGLAATLLSLAPVSVARAGDYEDSSGTSFASKIFKAIGLPDPDSEGERFECGFQRAPNRAETEKRFFELRLVQKRGIRHARGMRVPSCLLPRLLAQRAPRSPGEQSIRSF